MTWVFAIIFGFVLLSVISSLLEHGPPPASSTPTRAAENPSKPPEQRKVH